MKRRNFILSVVAGLSIIATKWHSRSGNKHAAGPDRALLVSGLTELFSDVKTATDVGELYLRTYSGNVSLAHLLSGVGIDPQSSRVLSSADFHSRRQRDFQEGQTVLINGWLMARSELCACALLACSQEAPGSL